MTNVANQRHEDNSRPNQLELTAPTNDRKPPRMSEKPRLRLHIADGELYLDGVTRESLLARIAKLETTATFRNVRHRWNSRSKWLGTTEIADCDELAKLTNYALHLAAKYQPAPTPAPEPTPTSEEVQKKAALLWGE